MFLSFFLFPKNCLARLKDFSGTVLCRGIQVEECGAQSVIFIYEESPAEDKNYNISIFSIPGRAA
jgi:hypothetical protein